MTPRQRDIIDLLGMLSAMRPEPTDVELQYFINQKVPGFTVAEAKDALRAHNAMMGRRHGVWFEWMVRICVPVLVTFKRWRGH